MSEPHDAAEREQAEIRLAWRPQFTLRWMFRAMLLVSVMAALLAGLLGEGISPASDAFLVVFWLAMTAPLGVMIVLSLVEPVIRLWGRIRSLGR